MTEEGKKERGPRFTQPQSLRLPDGSNYSAWKQSLEAQIKHQKIIMEEVEKCAANSSYKPKIKIGKKYEHFFKEEVIAAQHRATQKQKRKK